MFDSEKYLADLARAGITLALKNDDGLTARGPLTDVTTSTIKSNRDEIIAWLKIDRRWRNEAEQWCADCVSHLPKWDRARVVNHAVEAITVFNRDSKTFFLTAPRDQIRAVVERIDHGN